MVKSILSTFPLNQVLTRPSLLRFCVNPAFKASRALPMIDMILLTGMPWPGFDRRNLEELMARACYTVPPVCCVFLVGQFGSELMDQPSDHRIRATGRFHGTAG